MVLYQENEALKTVGKQNISLVPDAAKEDIYDIAKVYIEKSDMTFSSLLRFGTDIFILGFLYGKGIRK